MIDGQATTNILPAYSNGTTSVYTAFMERNQTKPEDVGGAVESAEYSSPKASHGNATVG